MKYNEYEYELELGQDSFDLLMLLLLPVFPRPCINVQIPLVQLLLWLFSRSLFLQLSRTEANSPLHVPFLSYTSPLCFIEYFLSLTFYLKTTTTTKTSNKENTTNKTTTNKNTLNVKHLRRKLLQNRLGVKLVDTEQNLMEMKYLQSRDSRAAQDFLWAETIFQMALIQQSA